jgi:hypothetical protein
MTIIPAGGFLKVTNFLSSGIWVKDPRTNLIVIRVIGGGSSTTSTAGTSVFTGVCSASGGNLNTSGSGSGGDLNITPRDVGMYNGTGGGGGCAGGALQATGTANFQNVIIKWVTGGSGGFAMKSLTGASIPDTVIITVGAAVGSGSAGSVEVTEYTI